MAQKIAYAIVCFALASTVLGDQTCSENGVCEEAGKVSLLQAEYKLASKKLSSKSQPTQVKKARLAAIQFGKKKVKGNQAVMDSIVKVGKFAKKAKVNVAAIKFGKKTMKRDQAVKKAVKAKVNFAAIKFGKKSVKRGQAIKKTGKAKVNLAAIKFGKKAVKRGQAVKKAVKNSAHQGPEDYGGEEDHHEEPTEEEIAEFKEEMVHHGECGGIDVELCMEDETEECMKCYDAVMDAFHEHDEEEPTKEEIDEFKEEMAYHGECGGIDVEQCMEDATDDCMKCYDAVMGAFDEHLHVRDGEATEEEIAEFKEDMAHHGECGGIDIEQCMEDASDDCVKCYDAVMDAFHEPPEEAVDMFKEEMDKNEECNGLGYETCMADQSDDCMKCIDAVMDDFEENDDEGPTQDDIDMFKEEMAHHGECNGLDFEKCMDEPSEDCMNCYEVVGEHFHEHEMEHHD